uniref:Nudix hydrolase 16 like 1 n=1 Tax=Podarcis muralis TaxID=64176 RepID=A0A670JFB4_PODMU
MPLGVAELRPLRRAEGLRLGPGWSHALLHAPHPGMLFARISLRYAVLPLQKMDALLTRSFFSSSCVADSDVVQWPAGEPGPPGFTHHRGPQQMVAHLYAKQLTLLELHAVEISAVHSRDHRLEVGLRGAPLHPERSHGHPSFLGNSFVSTAKFQLLYVLKVLNVVPVEKLAEAVAATQKPQRPSSEALLPLM